MTLSGCGGCIVLYACMYMYARSSLKSDSGYFCAQASRSWQLFGGIRGVFDGLVVQLKFALVFDLFLFGGWSRCLRGAGEGHGANHPDRRDGFQCRLDVEHSDLKKGPGIPALVFDRRNHRPKHYFTSFLEGLF